VNFGEQGSSINLGGESFLADRHSRKFTAAACFFLNKKKLQNV